jgi:hypothetical protein
VCILRGNLINAERLTIPPPIVRIAPYVQTLPKLDNGIRI